MLINILIGIALLITLITGFISINNEPTFTNTLSFGLAFSVFFILVGIRNWLKIDKLGAYLFWFAALVILLIMTWSI